MLRMLYIVVFMAIHECGSNILPEGVLLPIPGEKMTFTKSLRRCLDAGKSPLIPRNSKEWSAIAEAVESSIWIPADDKKQENMLQWTDDTFVNLSMVPWDGSQLINNAEGHDCMVMKNNGKVYMADCSVHRLAMICVPNIVTMPNLNIPSSVSLSIATPSSAPILNRSSINTILTTTPDIAFQPTTLTINRSSTITTTTTTTESKNHPKPSTAPISAITPKFKEVGPRTNTSRGRGDFATGTQASILTSTFTSSKPNLVSKRGPTWSTVYLLIAIILVMLFAFFIICVSVIAYTLGKRRKEQGRSRMSLHDVSRRENRSCQRPASSHIYEDLRPPMGPQRRNTLPSRPTSNQDSMDNCNKLSLHMDNTHNLPISPRRVTPLPAASPLPPSSSSLLMHLTELQKRDSLHNMNPGNSILPQFSSVQCRPWSKSCKAAVIAEPTCNQTVAKATDLCGLTNRAVSTEGIIENGINCKQDVEVDGTYLPMGVTVNKK